MISLPTVSSSGIADLCKALELLRIHDAEMTLQTAQCFFFIAAHEHCEKGAMEAALSLTTPTGSRHTLRLSDGKRGGKEPLGLIRRYCDKQDMRVKRLVLTRKGHALIQAIQQQLGKPLTR